MPESYDRFVFRYDSSLDNDFNSINIGFHSRLLKCILPRNAVTNSVVCHGLISIDVPFVCEWPDRMDALEAVTIDDDLQ